MLKKIFVIGAVVALTGCATHQQSNELAGAAVGGVIGNAVGGKAGAVFGAGVGAMIGGQQPTQRPQIVERQVITPAPRVERELIYREPHYQTSCRIFVERLDRCELLRGYSDRMSCRQYERSNLDECLTRRYR